MRSTMIAVLAAALCARGSAQPRFDVASVKLSDRSHVPYRLGPHVLTTDGSLKLLVMLAYGVEFYQVEGGPLWVQTEFYVVDAKSASAASAREIKEMLQTLLAERFQLKLRRETRAMPGYVLTVGKDGPKLGPPNTQVPPESTGVIQMGGGEIWSRAATMKMLAKGLWGELQRPVLDQTNIEGHYDFKLHFEEGNRELAGNSGNTDGMDKGVGSVFTAVREIGLRLEARKLPIEVLVIESAERPGGN